MSAPNHSPPPDPSTCTQAAHFSTLTARSTLVADTKPILHVEILCASPDSSRFMESQNRQITKGLYDEHLYYPVGCTSPYLPAICRDHTVRCTFKEVHGMHQSTSSHVARDLVDLAVHHYTLASDGPRVPSPVMVDGEERSLHFMSTLSLPHASLEHEWERLALDIDDRNEMLHYIIDRLRGSGNLGQHAGSNIIMLHGPPGTGKTSLCRALAQKAAIRLSSTVQHCLLVEVNAAGLLSKYLAQSQQQLTDLFSEVRRIADVTKTACFVLVDEVESIAANRSAEFGATGNREAMRATNRLLTLLDSVAHLPNIVFLFTSNMLEALDRAFVTRIPIIKAVELPSIESRYCILQRCFEDMFATGSMDSTSEFDKSTELVLSPECLSTQPRWLRIAFRAYQKSRAGMDIASPNIKNVRDSLGEHAITFETAVGMMQVGMQCFGCSADRTCYKHTRTKRTRIGARDQVVCRACWPRCEREQSLQRRA